jgi:hypothetical protein
MPRNQQPAQQEVQPDMSTTTNKNQSFRFVPGEQETSPDVGRLVELDDTNDDPGYQGDSEDFITDPMRTSVPSHPAGIEPEQAPVVTEKKTEPVEQELVIPVVVSRSQVRKTIPLKLRLEIRVVDD